MSLVNTGILRHVEIFLRVPPLFVIDEIIRFDAKLAEDVNFGNVVNSTISTNFFDLDPRTYKFVILCGIRLILSALGCLLAMCMFALNSKQLTLLFLHLVSVATVLISYWGNATTIQILNNSQQDKAFMEHSLQDMFKFIKFKGILDNEELTYQLLANLSLQTVTSFVFIQANLGFRHSSFKKAIPLLFLIPTLSTLLPIPSSLLRHTPLLAAFLALISTRFPSWNFIVTTFTSLRSSYARAKIFISRFGVPALLEYQWWNLSIPTILKMFYVLRTMERCVKFFAKGMWDIEDGQMAELRLAKYLLENGCDTCLAVFGLTAVLSSISDQLGRWLKNLLQSEDENDFGTATAIVFYTMVLQNELSSSTAQERCTLLYQTLILLLGIIFHFVHNVTNPVLISLSVSQSTNYKKHCNALGILGVLGFFSCGIVYFLCKTHSMSPFLLAATIFYAAVMEKVFISLIKYGLYLYDACRTTFWGKIDDYVFYATFFGNVTEICFHILLLLNGFYFILFNKPNIIRSTVLGIHSYFNIWCYGKADYLMYMKRRNALKKIESLPEASYYQIFKYNDVCAICYQEMKMKTAKVTKCNHIFHGICLRKWLNVRDTCPLCHEISIFAV